MAGIYPPRSRQIRKSGEADYRHTEIVHSRVSKARPGAPSSWHKVSAKHLPAYLEEMTFRFNRRDSKTLFLDTLWHMVTADPLTFEKLTA